MTAAGARRLCVTLAACAALAASARADAIAAPAASVGAESDARTGDTLALTIEGH